jgi:demethylmenaquinone methyltransferase/2-methoxy-6-polyprenyl-1,4-benzoquinol methylase
MSPAASPSRVARSRQAARVNYDRLSRWYAWLAASEEPFRRKAIDLLQAQPGEAVLEIGCGSGASLAALAARAVQPVGIDLSPGMLRVARKKTRNTMRRKSMTQHSAAGVPLLCQADGLHLPFPDGCFDGLLMTFTLELFDTPEIPRVLAECRRVLEQGGRVSLASLAMPASRAMPAAMVTKVPPVRAVRIYEWFHGRFPALVDCRPIPLQEMVEQAGFTIEAQSTANMWGLPVSCVLARR